MASAKTERGAAAQACVLILGGTGAATMLAQACAQQLPQLRTLTSLAGRTQRPALITGDTHVGGFGGEQGLTNFLQQNNIALVIDATHPFAAQISQHAARACEALAIPRLHLSRRPWLACRHDRWLDADDMADAARQLEANFSADDARVFLSTGRQQLATFMHLQRTWFLIRTVDPLDAPAPLTRCLALVGRGPFAVDDERTLLTQHRIDVLVSKNSGGEATFAKILAARSLSLPVIMLRPPPAPPGATVYGIDEAIAWLRARL